MRYYNLPGHSLQQLERALRIPALRRRLGRTSFEALLQNAVKWRSHDMNLGLRVLSSVAFPHGRAFAPSVFLASTVKVACCLTPACT